MPQTVNEIEGEYLKEMEMALLHAQFSPDPSTQNGAVLITTNGDKIAGCNEFPYGVKYTDDRWERPLKYSIIEHAERNSVYRAGRLGYRTEGATMVCPWAACSDCARAVIQSGIRRLVRLDSMDNTHEHWDESVRIGDMMMLESGIEILNLIVSEPFGIELRRNGEALTF